MICFISFVAGDAVARVPWLPYQKILGTQQNQFPESPISAKRHRNSRP